MADYTFDAPVRSDFGKGFARRTRAAGRVPAVIYKSGDAPVHISLPTHEVTQAVRLPNALFEVNADGKKFNALVKDIQRDFVTRDIEHIDLLEVKVDQKVTVPVELRVEGETKPGTFVTTSAKTVRITVAAGSIPRYITLNIAGAEGGAHYTIGDIELPEGAVPAVDSSRVITVVKERAKSKAPQIDKPGGGPAEESSEEAADADSSAAAE